MHATGELLQGMGLDSTPDAVPGGHLSIAGHIKGAERIFRWLEAECTQMMEQKGKKGSQSLSVCLSVCLSVNLSVCPVSLSVSLSSICDLGVNVKKFGFRMMGQQITNAPTLPPCGLINRSHSSPQMHCASAYSSC